MVRRRGVTLEDVAAWDNLTAAFWRAARGKRTRVEVQRFAARLDGELAALRRDVLAEVVDVGGFDRFVIHDPKRRVIHAPVFRERVLHHALMALVGPVLDRALVDDTYACRSGAGPLAAVHRAQRHGRRHSWYVKVDVARYFDSIDHAVLRGALERRLKNRGVRSLCARIIDSYATSPGRGLPIGALTSQHFANLDLAPLDRYLLEDLGVRGMVRYMDEVVWWCGSREAARATRTAVERFAIEALRLRLGRSRIQRSEHGLTFCGFRITRAELRLTRRRRARYAAARRRWEAAYEAGVIDALALQRAYASVLATTRHASAVGWRRVQLRRMPAFDV